MVTSRAAVFMKVGEPLVVEELRYPDPGPNEVLVKNYASGICHSQLHQMFGTLAQPGPVLLGHEATGIVEAAGANVTHVKEGDKVFVTWVPRNAKPGDGMPGTVTPIGFRDTEIAASIYTWSEHTLAPQEFVVKADEDIDNSVTSIIGCAVMTGAGAVINTADVQKGESVAIFGIGGVGMSAVAAAASREAHPIIAIDLDGEKLEFAKKFGATHTINASEGDPVAAIAELTGTGEIGFLGTATSGLDYAFDCIGVKQTIAQICAAVRPAEWGGVSEGGTAVLVGVPDGEATINALDMLIGAKALKASIGGSSVPEHDFPEFVRWYKEGILDLDTLVTKRWKLDDINEAVDELRGGKVFGRSILEF